MRAGREGPGERRRRRYLGIVAAIIGAGAIVAAGLTATACAPDTAGEAVPAEARPVAPTAEPSPIAPGTSIVRGTAAPATGRFASVVVLQPDIAPPRATPPEPELVDQYGMAFLPAVVTVRTGQAVEFRNTEDVIHNVNASPVDTTTTAFNVATVPFESYVHVFEAAGAYSLLCNVHATMAGYVFVTDSPYAVVADRDGSFVIEGVPYGAYALSVWNTAFGLRTGDRIEISEPETLLEGIRLEGIR